MSECVGHVIVTFTAFRLACWIQGVKPVKDHHISLIFATTKEFLDLNFLHHLKGPSGQNYIGFGLVIFRCTVSFKFLNFISNFYSYFEVLSRLKGQCHEIFCFWFFSWISFPQAPEYPIMTVYNFFKNSRRYSQVKVHHRYQRHRWQICYRCQWHRRQNCNRCQRHPRQTFPPVSLVLLIPVANLPPVSTT